MRFRYGVTITVHRWAYDRVTQDKIGDPEEHTSPGCALAPRTTEEDTSTGDTVVTGWQLYTPFRCDLLETDEVLLPDDPVPWFVDGEVGPWHNPFTDWQAGSECSLSRQK